MGGLSRFRTPWTAAALVVIAGIIGGVIVYRAGSAIRREDLAAYAVWERDAQPAVARARATHQAIATAIVRARALPSTTDPDTEQLADDLTAARSTLERARNQIQTVRIERVLYTIAATYLEAIARDLQAVSVLQRIVGDPPAAREQLLAQAGQRHRTAGARYRSGDEARRMLRARLRLEPL